ncbi:carbon-nitrogen hydrolase family protein [Nesterenkonia sp. HG001]|uniref:carbon-nitrogen hydrolase family protein n=1 Tax=Nesterenkonia sp. HG001 TaxID=2983207 RepID=UPI002AC449E4|nr:carbon-nitrogen hydrolase family protein [Nesterenkonia sp. HG001]MDZ5077517.1 carbon-nitrogen hydrolase family protein [Nesterenkonia sp. HG001]
MRIAAAQIVTGEDPQQNLALVEKWTAQAVEAGARLVVFPEAVQRAFGHSLTPIAEPVDGAWGTELRRIAERHGVAIVAGMFTPAQPGEQGRERVTNTLLAVDGAVDGTGNGVLAAYDKIHLYDAFGFQESKTVAPGEAPARFALDGQTLGLATCYDIRFPNLFTAHARAGALATILPASWGAGPGKVDQWRLLARARALDSTQYVIACGQGLPSAAGVEPVEGAPTGVGHSMIVSPTGEVLAEAGEAPELLVADLDADVVTAARQKLPVLANAREIPQV